MFGHKIDGPRTTRSARAISATQDSLRGIRSFVVDSDAAVWKPVAGGSAAVLAGILGSHCIWSSLGFDDPRTWTTLVLACAGAALLFSAREDVEAGIREFVPSTALKMGFALLIGGGAGAAVVPSTHASPGSAAAWACLGLGALLIVFHRGAAPTR